MIKIYNFFKLREYVVSVRFYIIKIDKIFNYFCHNIHILNFFYTNKYLLNK